MMCVDGICSHPIIGRSESTTQVLMLMCRKEGGLEASSAVVQSAGLYLPRGQEPKMHRGNEATAASTR